MVRTIPFTYNSTVSYKIELGDKYARITLDDVQLCVLETPYSDSDLLSIHYKQIGNTLWLVHNKYHPRKIIKTSETEFDINDVKFETGPFMTRNDLLDTVSGTPAYLKYTGNTVEGSIGSLLCCKSDGTTGVPFFKSSHVDSLFKLTTPRSLSASTWTSPDPTYYHFNGISYDETTYIQNGGTKNFLTDSMIKIKGTYTFTTANFIQGTNDCTIVLERSTDKVNWEIIRRETTSVVYSGTEKETGVYYRSRVLPASEGGTTPLNPNTAATAVHVSLTVTDTTLSGIVKVIGYTSESTVSVEVLSDLDVVEGIKKTNRWAEGAWSDYRGWPTSLTFYNDRCIYGGMKTIPEQVVY